MTKYRRFQSEEDFFVGQILWCDHGDREIIDASSRSNYWDSGSGTWGKIRPCLVVAVQMDSATIDVAPFSSFSAEIDSPHRWHPGWMPLDDPVFPIHRKGSKSIWMGGPRSVDMLLDDDKMYQTTTDMNHSKQPYVAMNITHYRERREAYKKIILKTYGERQPKPRKKSGVDRSSASQVARHGMSQIPPTMSGQQGGLQGQPQFLSTNQHPQNYNTGQQRQQQWQSVPISPLNQPQQNPWPGAYNLTIAFAQTNYPQTPYAGNFGGNNPNASTNAGYPPTAYNGPGGFGGNGNNSTNYPQAPFAGHLGGNNPNTPNTGYPPTAYNGPGGFGGNGTTSNSVADPPNPAPRHRHRATVAADLWFMRDVNCAARRAQDERPTATTGDARRRGEARSRRRAPASGLQRSAELEQQEDAGAEGRADTLRV
ncbi:hypothetical protein B0H15DRAFT_1010387 [Mycena belliarum]|uniref:Uncharacterized protein n=1 Tax=Mycena belliarum TaxID=1033014 RepID=A0AAD6TPS0_9AGAR|nr:hypothetical protein B0H15DRAFT_1010387 [Mycena belliae]